MRKALVQSLFLSAGMILGGCDREQNPPLKSEMQSKKISSKKEKAVKHESAHELLRSLEKQYGTNPEFLKNQVRNMESLIHTTQDSMIDMINASPNDEMYTISMDRVRKGPLGKMRKIKHQLGILLGGRYADSIMIKYNKELLDALYVENPRLIHNSVQWLDYANIHDTNVPHVYSSLKDFLLPSLKDFVADKPEIKQFVGNDNEVIIITRSPEKKHIIAYYRDGHIDMGHYISAGVGRELFEMDHRIKSKRHVHAFTPTGVFYTNYAKGYKRDSTYASKAFVSAMPYAVPISADSNHWDGVALHTGLADGNPRSHQCNRLPGWLAMYMYDHIGDRKVKVVIYDMYDSRKKSVK